MYLQDLSYLYIVCDNRIQKIALSQSWRIFADFCLFVDNPFFTKNALMPSISKICPDMVYLGVKNFFIGGKEVVFSDGFKNTHFTEFIID